MECRRVRSAISMGSDIFWRYASSSKAKSFVEPITRLLAVLPMATFVIARSASRVAASETPMAWSASLTARVKRSNSVSIVRAGIPAALGAALPHTKRVSGAIRA